MMMHDTFVKCINIHKSLIPDIKEKLIKKGITSDFVYPDTNKMKIEAIENASIKSLIKSRK